MNTYTQLALVAVIVIYIVDVSGFTASWRSALEKALGIKAPSHLRPLPPFDCSKCLVWWVCLAWALFACKEFTLPVVAYIAALSALSSAAASAIRAVSDTVINIFNFIADITEKR